jgi:hypothetical protein
MGTALDNLVDPGPEALDFIRRHVELGLALDREFPRRGVECPKRAVAYHEAGHAVVHHVQRQRVECCRLWPGSNGNWHGETQLGAQTCGITTDSPPSLRLRLARSTLAGLVGELEFTPELWHPGSSLDELILAKGLCLNAAQDLGELPERVLIATWRRTAEILRRRSGAMHGIAGVLMRESRIRGVKLQKALGGG